MEEKIVSACIGCWNEFGDKNKCSTKCGKRMGPVMKIGPMVASMEPTVKKVTKVEDTPEYGKWFFSSHLDSLISSICTEHGIDREMLHSKDGSTKILRPLRVKLAQSLSAEGLKNKEIAPLIGCSMGSVSNYINKKKLKTEAEQNVSGSEFTTFTTFGEAPLKKEIEMNGRTEYEHVTKKKQEEGLDNKLIHIDFKDLPDLYKDLLELSRERLRSPENQIIWILLKIQEKGMESVPE